jgi:hypothetical protein
MEFSPFLSVYRRYSKYASQIHFNRPDVPVQIKQESGLGQLVEFVVPRKGDIIQTIYLKFLLQGPINTDIYNFPVAFTNMLPGYLFEYFDLVIGDTVVERLNGDIISMHYQMKYNFDSFDLINDFTTGRYDTIDDRYTYDSGVTDYPVRHVFLPLPFYFFDQLKSGIPLFALSGQEVKVRMQLRSVYDIIVLIGYNRFMTSTTFTDSASFIPSNAYQLTAIQQIKINDFLFPVEYGYIGDDEQKTLLNGPPLRYFINQYQRQKVPIPGKPIFTGYSFPTVTSNTTVTNTVTFIGAGYGSIVEIYSTGAGVMANRVGLSGTVATGVTDPVYKNWINILAYAIRYQINDPLIFVSGTPNFSRIKMFSLWYDGGFRLYDAISSLTNDGGQNSYGITTLINGNLETNLTVRVPLEFINPVKELKLICLYDRQFSGNNYWYRNQYLDRTNRGRLSTFPGWGHHIESIALDFDGDTFLSNTVANWNFLSFVQPKLNHRSFQQVLDDKRKTYDDAPSSLFFYLYSFALDPDELEPTGYINFSAIRQPILTLNMFSTNYTNEWIGFPPDGWIENRTVFVYAKTINILEIQKDGTARLLFQNPVISW